MTSLLAIETIDVLPTGTQLPLSGFGKRKPSSTVIGIRECRIQFTLLKDAAGQGVLLCLADYLYFPNALQERINSHLNKYRDAADVDLVCAGSHTHSGPAFDFFAHETINNDYLTEVFDKCIEAVDRLFSTLTPCLLLSVKIPLSANFSINRRKSIRLPQRAFFTRKSLMLPNTRGSVSNWVTGLAFYSLTHRPLHLLLSYASHPVFNTSAEYSSDYPGTIEQLIIDQSSFPSVHLYQGFGGDIRPNFTKRTPSWRMGAKRWFSEAVKLTLYGAMFNDYTAKNFNSFCKGIAADISAKVDSLDAAQAEPLRIEATTRQFPIRSATHRVSRPLRIQHLSLQARLHLITAAAEVHCHYEEVLRNNNDHAYFCIGCTDQLIGYLPLPEDIPLGGYEVVNAAYNNGFDSPMEPKDLHVVKDYFDQIARNAAG